MQICIECGRHLFDYDKSCDQCHGSNIISEKEYKEITNEINNANIIIKKKLLQNDKYRYVYNIMKQSELAYPKPAILIDNQTEYDDEYWERINHHTINNKEKNRIPVVECPYCKSTNTNKISSMSKAGSVALFGVFALGKTTKQWHCNNCNSDF